MSDRTFSFKESCELLQINPKSFQEWLKKAGIDPNAQVDKFDPRKKFLTKSQVLMLAEAHGRVLPPLDENVIPSDKALSNEALAAQLVAVQQQHAQRFEHIDRMLTQTAALVQEIAAQQRDLQGRADYLQQSLTQAVSFMQELLPGKSANHSNGSAQNIGQQAAVEGVTIAVSPSPTPVKASTTKRQARPTTAKPSAKKKKTVRGKKLPTELVLLRDFASQHHIAVERASAAGKSRKINVVQGKWLVNSRWATEALDTQGKHDFYELFHQHEKFQPCEQCPHFS